MNSIIGVCIGIGIAIGVDIETDCDSDTGCARLLNEDKNLTF